MPQCRKCAYPLDAGEAVGQRCPNCGTPTREPEPEAPLPAILGTVWRRGPNEPVPGDSTATGQKPSDSGAQPRRAFEAPSFKAPVSSPASFFKPPPGKPEPAKQPAKPEPAKQSAKPEPRPITRPEPIKQTARPEAVRPPSAPAPILPPRNPPQVGASNPPAPANRPPSTGTLDPFKTPSGRTSPADSRRPPDALDPFKTPSGRSPPTDPRHSSASSLDPFKTPSGRSPPTDPRHSSASSLDPLKTPSGRAVPADTRRSADSSGSGRSPIVDARRDPSVSDSGRVVTDARRDPSASDSNRTRADASASDSNRSAPFLSAVSPASASGTHSAAGDDDLPTPVVSSRPFTIPRIAGKRITVQPVAAGSHELDSSAELDLPQILELSNLNVNIRADTVIASPRLPGSPRPDDVDVDLDGLHDDEPAPAPPAPEPPPQPPAAEPVATQQVVPRTPPPRPRPLPVAPPPAAPREPTIAMRAGVAALALAGAALWWFQFTRDATASPPAASRVLSLETWSEIHAILQARRLDTDRTADYLKALAEAEAHHDALGQAEAALCMHLRYGPDPVRSSAAEVWRAQADPADPRATRVAGLSALAHGKLAEAERLLVGDDQRTRLYRALTAQSRGDDLTAASEALAAQAQRPTDVAAALVAVTATLAARRTAPLDPLRAAAAAHADHPLYRQALVRALLDRGRLGEARTLADRIDRVNNASEAHQARALVLKAEVAAAGGEMSQAVWLIEKAGQLAPQDLPTQLARVRMLLAVGDRLRVQQELTQLTRLAPDDPEVLALQAEFALSTGNEAAATRAIDRLAAVADPRVARLRGEVHAQQNRTAEAIAAFTTAIDQDYTDVAAVIALAGLRIRSEPRAALAPLDATRQRLQADPRAAVRPKLRALALAHANLLAETGRKDQAIGVLDAALAADPDDNAAQLRRGELAIEQGRGAAGRADLAAVAERTGGYPGLAESLGRLYLRDNELVLLAALVQPHLSDPRASDDVLVMGGLLRLAQGEVDAAEALIDRVLLRSGSVWEARLAKARVLYTRGRLAEALAEVRLARPREPDAEVELWTGKILERLGKPQEAASAFRKARQLDPSLHEAAFLHGRSLLAQGLAREAIAELTAVTAATDAYPAAFIALGLALRERDQKEEALTHFLRAALLDPTSGEAAYWAGRTRVELGRPADSLYHLRRAVLAQNPGPWHADAHLWLARALVKQNQRDEAASMYTTYLRLAGPRAAARAEAEKLARSH